MRMLCASEMVRKTQGLGGWRRQGEKAGEELGGTKGSGWGWEAAMSAAWEQILGCSDSRKKDLEERGEGKKEEIAKL